MKGSVYSRTELTILNTNAARHVHLHAVGVVAHKTSLRNHCSDLQFEVGLVVASSAAVTEEGGCA
jgi:hypothetical protein